TSLFEKEPEPNSLSKQRESGSAESLKGHDPDAIFEEIETGQSATVEWHEADRNGRFRAEEHSPLLNPEDANTLSTLEDARGLFTEEADHTAALTRHLPLTVEETHSSTPPKAALKETDLNVFLQQLLLNQLVAATPLFKRARSTESVLITDTESGSTESFKVEGPNAILEDKETGASATAEWNEANTNWPFNAEAHSPLLKQEDANIMSKVEDRSVLLTEESDHAAAQNENSEVTVEGTHSNPPPEVDDIFISTEMEETDKNAALKEIGPSATPEWNEADSNARFKAEEHSPLLKHEDANTLSTSEDPRGLFTEEADHTAALIQHLPLT
ncbi:unnamed protein product, partial [Didymodactylos carnosus]